MEKISVVFMAVPDSLKDDLRDFFRKNEDEVQEASFTLNPSILLPVELEPGKSALDPEKLSWEMILSGMLRIISACGRKYLPENYTGRHNTPETAIKNGDTIELDITGSMETPGVCGTANIPYEWVNYYRRFVFTVKPKIYHEFTGASIVKAKNEEFDMALEINAVLEGLFPGSPGVLLNRALILENKALSKSAHECEKEDAEALNAYETALSLEPVLPDTFFNAGFFFMRLGNYRRAKDCFSRYVSVGEETEKKKQAKKIIMHISGQGLDDDNFMEAYDLINRGNAEKGLSKIREFLGRRPKVWNGWFVLGWALRKQGRYSDGLDSFKKALELGGAGGDLKNETAICLMELGDYNAARKELEHALHDEPENIKIISNLGVLALKTGSPDEAASYFRTVLELSPDDEIAKRFLEKR
jgi:tetratricopeptide (TPR) repeat protein